jgi:hypothetical protein
MTRRHVVLAGCACLVLAMTSAGCGGTSSTSTKTVTVTRTTTVTETAPPASGATTSPVGAVSAPRCRTTQLSVHLGTNGAAGQIELYTTFTNRSHASCSLYGYPGLGLVSRSGSPMHTVVLRTRTAVIPRIAEHVVVLKPQGRASFIGSFQDAFPLPCPQAARLEVTPPNDDAHLTVAAAITPCHGVIHVSPVFPPNSSF